MIASEFAAVLRLFFSFFASTIQYQFVFCFLLSLLFFLFFLLFSVFLFLCFCVVRGECCDSLMFLLGSSGEFMQVYEIHYYSLFLLTSSSISR